MQHKYKNMTKVLPKVLPKRASIEISTFYHTLQNHVPRVQVLVPLPFKKTLKTLKFSGFKVFLFVRCFTVYVKISDKCTLFTPYFRTTEEELETLKERAAYFGLDKTKDFEDYKKKYLKASDRHSVMTDIAKQYGIGYRRRKNE